MCVLSGSRHGFLFCHLSRPRAVPSSSYHWIASAAAHPHRCACGKWKRLCLQLLVGVQCKGCVAVQGCAVWGAASLVSKQPAPAAGDGGEACLQACCVAAMALEVVRSACQ